MLGARQGAPSRSPDQYDDFATGGRAAIVELKISILMLLSSEGAVAIGEGEAVYL